MTQGYFGAGNDETKGATRVLFNLGFRNPSFEGNMGYIGYLRPTYYDKIPFGEITSRLKQYSKGDLHAFDTLGNGLSVPV
jgi:hypothetical protein